MTTSTTQAPAPARRPSRRARLTASARLLGVSAGLRALERVAPARADALAFRLWCTLPANAGRRRDLRPSPGELPGTLVRLAAPRGGAVVAETWGDGPPVYLVHGWGGWRGQLGAFVRPLVDAGHRVVAVDGPSHGDSDPGVLGRGKGTLIELVEALEVAGEHFGAAAGVIGHSLGCTVATTAIRGSLRAGSLVLIAPNHDFHEIVDAFVAGVGLSRRTRDGLVRSVETFVDRPMHSFDLGPLGADGTLPRTLVVHDRWDKETPYRVGADLAERWPTAELLTTEGLGHQRILADPATVTAVVEHIGGAGPGTAR